MGFFGSKETDPVCKMKVDPKGAAATYVWEGKNYYFCSPGCKTKFEGNPGKYLSGASRAHSM